MIIKHLINSILLLLTFTLCINLHAQVKTKVFYTDVPSKFKPLLKAISKTNKIEPPSEFYNLKNKIISEDIQFAIPVKVNVDFTKEALFEENNDMNLLAYSLSIEAKDALNLSLQFSEFKLPKSAILSIYTKNELTDSITSSQNNENNIWATRVYQGNTLSIVLKIHSSDKDKVLLKIGNVNFGYKNFGVQFDFANPGASAPCHINANCPAGNNWNNEKNSVAMIVANGIIQCTGSLIMNTCNTNTPYFLTANHCLGAGNVPNWVFQFQTLSTDCATNVGWREDIQFNGCVLRANNGATDFALLELNTTPAANSGLFYSGWSRQTTGNTSTTVLHHPAGDLMKISVDNQAPTSLTSLGVDVWQIDQDLGRLQGGSSGAPYYNQNHQIIGQHWRRPEAGARPICDITIAQGGRFDRSWTGGGTNSTRLSNWLDPNNTGAIFTNTTNRNLLAQPNQGAQPFSLIKQYNNQSCNEINVIASGIPNGVSITWTTTNGALINGNPSPITTSSNSVLISSNLSTTITALSQNGTCTFSSSSSFCPCEPWDNPVINWIYSAPATNEPLQAEVSPAHPDAIRYEWYINGQLVETTYGTFLSTYNWPCTSEGEGLSVIAVTTCGISAPVFGGTYSPICYQYRINSNVKLYPNPASTQVIVKLEDLNSKITSTLKSIVQIKIIDKMGVTRRVLKFSKGNLLSTINVSDLPSDIYYLDITDGSTQVRKPLIIRR